MAPSMKGRRTSRAASARRSRRRDEEQLELAFTFVDDRVVPVTRYLIDGERADSLMLDRADPAIETRSKRLRHGVLVQQFLK